MRLLEYVADLLVHDVEVVELCGFAHEFFVSALVVLREVCILICDGQLLVGIFVAAQFGLRGLLDGQLAALAAHVVLELLGGRRALGGFTGELVHDLAGALDL